jgi:hypothetical protein
MKQLLPINPIFTPGAAGVGTLDFSRWPNFSIDKLYAVINVTQNTPIFVAGAPNLGVLQPGSAGVTAVGNNNIIILQANTATHNPSDRLNVYYDTQPGYEANTPAELGGQLQMMQETMDQTLVELKIMNMILLHGLNISTISVDDVEAMRNDHTNIVNYPSTY